MYACHLFSIILIFRLVLTPPTKNQHEQHNIKRVGKRNSSKKYLIFSTVRWHHRDIRRSYSVERSIYSLNGFLVWRVVWLFVITILSLCIQCIQKSVNCCHSSNADHRRRVRKIREEKKIQREKDRLRYRHISADPLI